MSKIINKFYKTAFGKEVDNLDNIDLNNEHGRQSLRIQYLSKLDDNILKNTITNSNIDTVEELFVEKVDQLQYKISKVVEKVRGAILAERGTSGAIYTTQIPINKQQITENTTTKIEDGIAFGVPQNSEEYASDLTLLKLSDLTFKDLYLKTLNKHSSDKLENFSIESPTQNSKPIEFTINLSGIIKTSASLVLDMKHHGIVEVYKNGELVSEKSLKQNIIVPVDANTTSVGIRSYPTIHRISVLTFNKIGYTELIYNEPTYLETKNITIGKDFSQIVIDTCDNSNEEAINIDYHISINDQEWESFSPVMKHNAIEKQSIITVDKSRILSLYNVQGTKIAEGDYRFNIPESIQTNFVYKSQIFLRNNKKIKNKPLTLILQEDVVLLKNAIQGDEKAKVIINGREVTTEVVTLYKGINKIFSEKNKELVDINLDYLEGMIGTENIYIHVYEKDIIKNSETGLKYVSLSRPEFEDSFDTVGEAYFTGIKPKQLVSTVKIKAKLQSLDQKTVPFISRILVRGV